MRASLFSLSLFAGRPVRRRPPGRLEEREKALLNEWVEFRRPRINERLEAFRAGRKPPGRYEPMAKTTPPASAAEKKSDKKDDDDGRRDAADNDDGE